MTILASSQTNLKAQMGRRRAMTMLASSQMNLKAKMVTGGRLTDDEP